MMVLLPRLDREGTRSLVEHARGESVSEIAGRMPARQVRTYSSPLGGLEISESELAALRAGVVDLAREHGYPEEGTNLPRFDAKCARLVHERLPISPHEASEEDAWSYLTCAWLLDVAAWRWGGIGESDRRLRGDVNRNTFRRLWWRAEVLGARIDLSFLGEDELVNIMERPTIAANRRLARTLATQFLARVSEGDAAGRMMLMRDAGKRLVRLTPIIDFHVMSDAELQEVVEAVLVAAADGGNVAMTTGATRFEPSDAVEEIDRLVPVADESAADTTVDFDPTVIEQYGEVAIGIAGRTGRVTNTALREVIPLEAADARKVLQGLVDRKMLARRGRAKGTYYVLPDSQETESAHEEVVTSQAQVQAPGPSEVEPGSEAQETALRRFLRRRG